MSTVSPFTLDVLEKCSRQIKRLKIHKFNTTQKSKQRKIQQNKTTLPFITLNQDTRWAYSTVLSSHHGVSLPATSSGVGDQGPHSRNFLGKS